MDYLKFEVAKRSCHHRWTLLQTKYQKRMSEELQASGIDLEVSESNAIIEDVFAKKGQKKTKAMERLGQSSKRNGDEGEGAKKKKEKVAAMQ